MKYKYEIERELIINDLSNEIDELSQEIKKEREIKGFTAQYRALSKTYNDATKHYLNLVKEVEAENTGTDALTEFNMLQPLYDENGGELLKI